MVFFNKRDKENNYLAINWNQVNDMLDKMTWEKLVEQFWTDTRIPISNDKDDWRKLPEAEKTMVGRVFGGLTLLDTLQSQDGVSVLKPDVLTQHEEAVLNNIGFMECLTEESRVFKKNKGWISVKDVKKGDVILQYLSDTNEFEFGEVLETSSHKSKDIYRMYNNSKGIELKMSKGHRIIFRDLKTEESREILAKDFFKLSNEERKDFVFVTNAAFTSSHIKDDKSADIQLLKLLTVKGLIMKGMIKVKKVEGRLELSFKSASVQKYSNVREILKNMGWKVKSNMAKQTLKTHVEDENDIKILLTPIHEFLDVENRSKMEIRDIVESLLNYSSFDEWTDKYNKLDSRRISFYSKDLKEMAVMETFLEASGTIYHYDEKGEIVIDKIGTHTDEFVFANSFEYHVDIDANEEVYGIRVPSGCLVVKTPSGKKIVTGNSMHAKSYSSIFSTLNTPAEIDEIFEWTNSNQFIQNKAKIISDIYENGTPLKKKAASVMLESFLFYSGFYAPLYYLGINKLPNVAEVIRLIVRDESVHGTYIGAKFRIIYNQLTDEEQEEIRSWVYNKVYELYFNEELYTQTIYDEIGWTNDVLVFVRYNANKALQNLGFDSLFSDTAEDVNPIVMNGLSTGTANHDFFSQVGNGYRVAPIESMSTEDYDY